MHYLLIPLEHAVPSLGNAAPSPDALGLTVETCELLVDYALDLMGRPSMN